MYINQHTLKGTYTFQGKGLHTGKQVSMTIAPAPENSGIRFKRTDMKDDAPLVEAWVDYVSSTSRGTTLKKKGIKILTLEHLMGALYGLGVDNALISLDSSEVPILDGSAKFYADAISKDGLAEQSAPRKYLVIKEKIECRNSSGSIITVEPSDEFSVDLTIAFNSKVLARQDARFDSAMDFASEIAPCRTFVFFNEIEPLLRLNLIKGGDLDNAIVIVDDEIPQKRLDHLAKLFNMPGIERVPEGYLSHISLRFPNECARHKLLDVLGDFSLVGYPIKAKVTAFKSGHSINTEMAKKLRDIALKQF
jgi:UDP-3-O-[3-hydroxymyristoyl] N-acetylglucosamine deacetylase/3-hydroxyacyl-[acyl-carrier-protein] dehydratase